MAPNQQDVFLARVSVPVLLLAFLPVPARLFSQIESTFTGAETPPAAESAAADGKAGEEVRPDPGVLVARAEHSDSPQTIVGPSVATDLAAPSVAVVEAERDTPSARRAEAVVIEPEAPKVKKKSTTRFPDMHVENLTLSGSQLYSRRCPSRILPPWALYGVPSRIAEPPDFVRVRDTPILFRPPPRETRFARAIRKIARRKFHSEVRRMMKREWRRAFRETPTMSYSFYEERLTRINRLGRNRAEADDPKKDYFTNQLRADVFQRSNREGEEDFPLIAWGPLVVLDSGSVRLHPGRLLDSPSLEEVKIETEDDGDDEPAILASKDYRVRTSVRLGFDPIEAYKESDPTWVIDRYGLEVSVDWFSDILARKVMTAEFEVEFERDGDFAAMINLVIKSRK